MNTFSDDEESLFSPEIPLQNYDSPVSDILSAEVSLFFSIDYKTIVNLYNNTIGTG